MPISIGSISVSKIGLGGVNVTKGYLGTNLVFGGTNCSYLSVITIPKQYYYVTRVSAGSGIFVAVASQFASGQQVAPGIYGHVIYISEDGNTWTPVYGPSGSISSPYVGQLTVRDIATFPNSEVFYIVGSIDETYGTFPNETTYGRVLVLLQKTFVQGQETWNFSLQGYPPDGYSSISLETADVGVNSGGGASIGIALTSGGQALMSYIFNPGSIGGGGFNNITATNTGGMAYVSDVAVGGPEVNNLIVAVGANSGTSVRNFMTSLNGVTWTFRDAPQSNWWTGVAWGGGKFVAVARSGSMRVATSTDGITWTGQTAAENNYWTAVAYGGGLFVAVANQGTNRMMASPNGIRWFSVAGMPEGLWGDIEYGNGKFIACATSNAGDSRVILFDPVNYMNCTILVETITIQSATAQTSGSDRVLTVVASLTNISGLTTSNDLEYQWQYAAEGSNMWTNLINNAGSVSGATAANLTLSSTYMNLYATRQHRVIVSSIFAVNSVTSDAIAGLNVTPPNVTITQPSNSIATYKISNTEYGGFGAYSGTFSTSATTDNVNDVISYSWETRQSSSFSFVPLSSVTNSLGSVSSTSANVTVLSLNVAAEQQWAVTTTNAGMADPSREYRCRIRIVRQGTTFDFYTNTVQMSAVRVAAITQIADLNATQYAIWTHSYDAAARKHTLTYYWQPGGTYTPCFNVVTAGILAFKPIPTPTSESPYHYLIPGPTTASIPSEPNSAMQPATFKTLWPDAINNGWQYMALLGRASTPVQINANTVFILGQALPSGSGNIYYIGAARTFELYEM